MHPTHAHKTQTIQAQATPSLAKQAQPMPPLAKQVRANRESPSCATARQGTKRKCCATGMPQVRVYTTGNRYKTAHELDKDFNYIICDDGFEDSRLAGAITFRLDWGNPPASLGDLLPAGNCRSLPADHGEPAHALACGKDVRFEIANVINSEGVSASALADASHKPIAICGIGNTTRFVHDLETFGIHPEYTIRRPDHDIHFSQAIVKALSRQSPVIITEKDAARLPRDMRKNPGIYVAYQRVTVSEGATDTILHVIRA